MISDSKRCEVSRKLRMLDVDGIEHGYELLEEVADCIGDEGVKYGAYERFAVLLADLIEPPRQCPCYDSGRHWCSIHDVPIIDRAALLALAEEMGHPIKQAVWNQTAGVRREHVMAEYARRIREALRVES